MQTWDMNQALRARNGSKGIIPFEIPGIGVYECHDGHVFGYLGTPGGAPWSEMLQWMIEEGMAEDLVDGPYPDFCANLNLRFLTGLVADPANLGDNIKKMSHIAEVLRRFVGTKSKWDMYQQGQARRLLWGIVSTPKDIAENPQLKFREWLTPVEHPGASEPLRYPGPPYRFSETPWAIRQRPPLVGEHNAEVLVKELGVSEDEFGKLREAGVV